MEGKATVCKKLQDRREHGAMYRRAYWPNEGARNTPKTYSPTPEEYKKCIDPQQVNHEGRTPLHLTIIQGGDDDQQLERIIKLGCDINSMDTDGFRGIHFASERGKTRCIQRLVKHGAKLNVLSKCGYSPLMLAARHDYPKAVRALVRSGADPNLENDKNEQALHYAVCKGHLECVQDLIANRASVNHANADGSTPLILATQLHQIDVMRSLISAGVKLDHQDMTRKAALHWVATIGTVQEAQILVEAGAETDVFDMHGLSPFVYSVQINNYEVLRYLLSVGCDRSTVDGLNGTALALASLKGHNESVEILLETGDDPDELGFFGLSPLVFATFESHEKVVRTLLQYGADPNNKGRMGATPLIKALIHVCPKNEKQRHNIIAMLIRAGACVNARCHAASYFTTITNGKNCPLSFALCSGYTSLMRMLMIAGSKVACHELHEWSMRDNIDKYYTRKTLFGPIRDLKYKPKSLLHLSRMTIRNSLQTQGWEMSKIISKLPIAPVLQKYVDFSDLDDVEPQKAELLSGTAQDLLAVQPIRIGCPNALRNLEGTLMHQIYVQNNG